MALALHHRLQGDLHCAYTSLWGIAFPTFSVGHDLLNHFKHGTLSLLTLDPALPYRHLNAISKPTFSLILNWRHKHLCIPRRTLWRYTNVLLYYIIMSESMLYKPSLRSRVQPQQLSDCGQWFSVTPWITQSTCADREKSKADWSHSLRQKRDKR